MQKKVTFVTHVCTHYTIKLFELLSEKHKFKFYFTGSGRNYRDKNNEVPCGNFDGKYLKGVFIFPKFGMTFGLFKILFEKQDIFIKTIVDRFALPFVFLVAKILIKPFILWTGMWMHPNTFFHKISYGFTKFIYRHSDAIIVYGEHVKRYLVGLGIDTEKIFIAPHSVDNTLFDLTASDVEKSQLKKNLGLNGGKIILCVGRLEECKGHKYLIEAIAMIKDIPVTLLLIGRGSKKDALEQQCKSSSIKYRFLGYVPNDQLYRYFSIAEIFVLPSITTKDFKEPWGLVINEAMNQGCPIIATDAVGAAAGGLVENGKNGLIVPEKNSLALKEAIEALLRDQKLRDQMSQSSRERIKKWSIEKMVTGFISAIDFVSQPPQKDSVGLFQS
ncbi:MAG: glycosyltransferase family 4 protein [Candidatus Omnitrophota bacterium]|nr:glycosyltransferase family 4 protein [Candidatus Omnitrophota bacterium]